MLNNIVKKCIGWFLCFLLLVGLIPNPFMSNKAYAVNNVSIGVMRYDSKVGGDARDYTASFNALKAKKWGDTGYWPFWASTDANGNLTALNENTVQIMEQENQYAYDSGIDYWAFLHGPDKEEFADPNSSGAWHISEQFNRYLESSNKNLVKYTFIFNWATFLLPGTLDRALNHMTDPQWVTVLGGRPLLYIYNNGFNDLTVIIPHIRDYVQNTLHLPNPYIVLYNDSGKGEDAYSTYGMPQETTTAKGAPYSQLISESISAWTASSNTHNNYVPNAMHNWDNRPFYETPPPWGCTGNYWYVPPTKEEYRQMVQAGVNFVLSNPNKCPAMTICTKEWNGQEEGGNICPSIKYGTQYIDAIKMVNKSSIVTEPIVDSSLKDKMQFRVYNGSVNSDADADYTQEGGHSGSYSCVHWKNEVYSVDTYQYMRELTNGTYTMKAWVKSSSDLGNAYMYVKNYGGSTMTCNIPANSSGWQQITISGINVINSECFIGFYSENTPAGKWYCFDDVEFYKDPALNLVENPGFEYGLDPQNPTYWQTKGVATPAPDLNKYTYEAFSNTPYTFQSGDYIEYDIKLLEAYSGTGGIDIFCTDQSSFSTDTWSDQNGITGNPACDLTSYANNTWYHRKLAVPSGKIGKTASEWLVAGENDSANITYTALYDNITVTNGNGEVRKNIFCISSDSNVQQVKSQNYASAVLSFENTGGSRGENVILNSGFELGTQGQNPQSWSTAGSDADADYTQGSGAHSGSYQGVHWKGSPYTVDTYQTKTGLANGTYTLRAWVKSSSSLGTAYMYAKDFGGTMRTYNIPLSLSEWQQITIPDINVTNGQCTIGFYSGNTPASEWYGFDDVEFYQNTLNLVQNPGFELGTQGQNPQSWSTAGSDVDADYTQGSGAHSGNYQCMHSKDLPYTVDTYQTITGLTNGTYTLKAWVYSSGDLGAAYMYAKDFGGTMKTYNIPLTFHWQQITISGVNVTNGQCTIGFYSGNTPAMKWYKFDDVEFYKEDPPPLNLIQNPGFELGTQGQNPQSWSTAGSDADADYTQGSGAHSGSHQCVHWKGSPYTVDTYQTKTGLANGTYTLRAWVKSSSSLGTSYMYAKDFGGTAKTYNIPLSSYDWQQITINGINVTNGQCTIGFYSGNTPASEWYGFDDIEFFKE